MKKFSSAWVLALFALSSIFLSCSNEKQISEKISAEWKYKIGDSMAFASPDYNDETWKNLKGISIPLGDNHYVWLRSEISVPAKFLDQQLWLGMDRYNAAAEFYADGVFIGKRGNLPPNLRVRIEENSVVNIPLSAVHDGKLNLAVRLYCPSDKVNDLVFYFDNAAKAEFESIFHNQFGPRFFLVLTYLCIFIMFYSFAVFLGNTKDKAYLYYSLSMLFIIPYFLDIGSEMLFMPYNLQRSLCRACLPVSLVFIGLFLNRFFDRKGHKLLLGMSLTVIAIAFGAYLFVMGKQDAMDLMFNIMLLPCVVIIVYGFVTSTRAFQRKEPFALNIFLGFTAGSIFAMNDIIYMFIGKVPFMWTQALAFFALDLAIFITLSMRSANSFKALERLSKESEANHKRLSEIVANAQKMANETANISNEMANSVDTLMNAAKTSRDRVSVIDQAIKDQTDIYGQTSDTIQQLANSLQKMNSEFDNTTESIKFTAEGTLSLMDGIANVSEGIVSAENFTRSLSTLTTTGSQDMHRLLEVIESIQQSSKEILSVVTTLDDFAQQTDLLSMNAAIEAAHTGDAGKGFAVIAHEIKDLAANSSTYATKIGEIVTGVINSISESVRLTEKVNQTFIQIQNGAGQSVEKVSAASASIKTQVETGNGISRESAQMSESATRMKQNVEEQSSYSKQVLNNMEKLNLASSKVQSASAEISSETLALAEQVESLRVIADRTRETAWIMNNLMNTDSGVVAENEKEAEEPVPVSE